MTDPRSSLPSVDGLVRMIESESFAEGVSRPILVDCARSVVDAARSQGGSEPKEGWADAIKSAVEETFRPTLLRTINATGVVLHTNLGRAPLADAAVQAIQNVAGYNTLEYDLAARVRGSRQHHVRGLICRVTGADEALVTNNAASALTLLLNTVSRGMETIVSRGELVEIGDAFRIPEILERSGCTLIEVGATNRTHLRDYERALSPRTGAVLKVHRSNFIQTGFVSETDIDTLVAFARPRGVEPIHDVGSGLLLDLAEFGLSGEPLVQDSVRTGASVVFSGDKLLGGPQAGIIVGPRDVIEKVSRNPLARALRPDKIVLAALEATLRLYLDRSAALHNIPTLKMLTTPPAELHKRAASLAALIPSSRTEPGHSSPGGGSFPGCEMPTTLVTVPTDSPNAVLENLTAARPYPLIARAGAEGVLLDPRTLSPDEFPLVAEALAEAL